MSQEYRENSHRPLVAKLLKTESEKRLSFSLRHEVFTKELEWVDSEEFEMDEFDKDSDVIGIFHGSKLVASVRITNHKTAWMIDKVLANFIENPVHKTPDSVETTRYLVSPQHRGKQQIGNTHFHYAQILQLAVYEYCRIRKIIKNYGVFLFSVYRLLKMQGVPIFRTDSKKTKKESVPALVDWRRLNKKKFLRVDLFQLVAFYLDE